jgi:nucleoside-diphosphate-sugar epimerase
MTYHRISILGCGWLGFPLGIRLLERDHFVRGSTTTKDKIPLLEEAGIEPYHIQQLDPRISGDDVTSFFRCGYGGAEHSAAPRAGPHHRSCSSRPGSWSPTSTPRRSGAW